MSDGVDQLVCRAARQAFASAASSIHFSFWIGLPVRPMDAWHEDVMVVISHSMEQSKNRLLVPWGFLLA